MTSTIIITVLAFLLCAYIIAYVRKRRENKAIRTDNARLEHIKFVAQCTDNESCKYTVEQEVAGYVVYKVHPRYPYIAVAVKKFCDYDMSYALRCAEELRDMLNEKN